MIDESWLARPMEGWVLVLPDGCLDVIEHHGKLSVIGPMTSPQWVEIGVDPPRGIRWRPGCVYPWLDTSLDKLRDEVIDADQFAELGQISTLEEVIDLSEHSQGRADIRWVAEALRERPNQKIADLAKTVGISSRQLRRLFSRHIGLSPKEFARIQRVQSLVEKFESDTETPLGELAFQCGYADQSHMNRDVVEFCQLTPSDLRLVLSDSFKTESSSP